MSLWRRISASTNLSPEGEQYIVVYAHQTAAVITEPKLDLSAFPFDSVNGFGSRLVQTTDVRAGTQNGGRIAFSPSGAALATTYAGSGTYDVIEWDEGFGSLYASQPSSPANPDNVQFHPDGDFIFYSEVGGIIHGTKIYAYNFSDASGIGSQFGGTFSVSNSTQDWVPLAVSPNGNFVAAGYPNSAYLAIAPFSKSTGLGTKVEPTDSSLGVDEYVWDVTWNNAGTYVAIGCNSDDDTQRLQIWEWNNATGTFGSKVTGISISPSITSQVYVYAIAFTPDDDAIIIGCSDGKLEAYAWDNSTGTFGSKYAAPASAPPKAPTDLKFNTNGTVLFASGGANADVPVRAWQWNSATGFGAKYDDPDSSTYGLDSDFYSIAYKDFG